jgi:hypothetical protein
MEELGVSRGEGSRPRGVDDDYGLSVQWGGTAGTTTTDLDEQERLLMRMFKPHKVRVRVLVRVCKRMHVCVQVCVCVCVCVRACACELA